MSHIEQTLFNWVKAKRQGRRKGADGKVVSAEQMEVSRLQAELARAKMERDILGRATAAQAACAEPVLIEVLCSQGNSRRASRLRLRRSPVTLAPFNRC